MQQFIRIRHELRSQIARIQERQSEPREQTARSGFDKVEQSVPLDADYEQMFDNSLGILRDIRFPSHKKLIVMNKNGCVRVPSPLDARWQ
jgi:hypothetical protein